MSKVKMIKSDAIINIGIGTGFLQNLQKLMFFIVSDVTEKDLKEYQELVQNKEPFTEDWMTHLTTVSVLIKEIEQKSEEQGFVYETDIPDDFNQPDGSQVLPTELQPE